jgi:hypothetical protein
MKYPQRLYQEWTINSVESGINAIYKACRFYIFSTFTFRPGEKSRLNSMLNVISDELLTHICVVSNHDSQTQMAQQRKWQSIHGRECNKKYEQESCDSTMSYGALSSKMTFFPCFYIVKHTILLYNTITNNPQDC